MSDQLRFFRSSQGAVAVSLPLDPAAIIADWSSLRSLMVHHVPPAFTRDEWAYLIAFLDSTALWRPFRMSFGEPLPCETDRVAFLYRPRGLTGLWLPNNVSLLGPLTLILLSLTGQPLRVKAGSAAEDLTSAFLAFAIEHLRDGSVLRHYLMDQVRCEVFDRTDLRNADMAAATAVRIVFGSDAATRAIDALPHPLSSAGFHFFDRSSEAWVQAACLDDQTLADLLRVFAIYGQAGCTSPKRVVLLEGDPAAARSLMNRLIDLWPTLFRRQPPRHVASANLMAHQWAMALGWDARLTPGHGAVLACGDGLSLCNAPLLLTIVPASIDEAFESLPPNIQTIGHALEDPGAASWLQRLAASQIKRFVPIRRMHHFGPVWDGWEFWRQLFEVVELQH